jgi:group I intron endonuclease
MILYEILNIIDNKRYVGITGNLKRRWKEHRSELKTNTHHNKHLQSAWNMYGKDSFKFNIINEFNNLDELNKAEIEFIDKYDLKNPTKGYNLADGGNSFEHSQEAKDKIIKSQLKSVICKCVKTGNIKVYESVKSVLLDGYHPHSVGGACNLKIRAGKNYKFQILTHKSSVWMYLDEYKLNPAELDRRFNLAVKK